MSDDIVARLRRRMEWWKDDCEDLREAADEITRLRADLAAVTAERDRLQILHDESYIAGMKHGWNCCAEGDEARYKKSIENTREQIRLARAAIEGVTEPANTQTGER